MLRTLHLNGALGAARTEWLGDREYLVVPTVALVGDNVIHAVNAAEAEFVPSGILSPDGWEHRPLMLGHPTKDGVHVSANDPKILTAQSFGFTASPKVADHRLSMESWCDVRKLEDLGQHAMLADLRAGKPVEVSTGSIVQTARKPGAFNGKRYAAEWTSIGPDHLAFLPGGVGACSLDMGCGAHRAAERYLVTLEGLEVRMEQTIIDSETLKCLRDIPQSERDAMPATDFAGPDQSFPIKTQADVDAAKRLIGKAKDPEAVKAKIIAIAKRKGLTVPDAWKSPKAMSSIKARILALFDTPEQMASEEAAELIGYQALRAQLDLAGKSWDEMSALVDALIADEMENPTETPAQEDAEEEVEDARLMAFQMHLMSMSSAVGGMMTMTSELRAPDLPAPSDPRYMEAFRAAIGKSISAANMKTIQKAHDSAHDMHAQTVALGAACNGMKLLAAKDCPACDGTGQVKDGSKQMDCAACDGTGLKAAAAHGSSQLRAACGSCDSSEGGMTKTERIAALLKNEHNPIKDLTEKTSDDVLTVLEAQAKTNETHASELKAAQAKQAETDTALKAAQAAQIPAEELTQLRSLAAQKAAQDAVEKTALVTKLVAASKALTKEQLEAKSLDELKTLAAFAKVDAPDFSARGVPVPRNANQADEYAPPDPYAAGIKALQEKATVN